MKKPLASVIIPSINSEKTIKKCLMSIKNQTYNRIEIVVVDRNSQDKTIEIAKQFTKSVYLHEPERSAQINYGASKAKGKYIYRVDSDFVLEKDVVRQCVEKCEKEKLDGIAVHNTSAEGLGFWAEVRKFERNTYKDDDLIVAVRFFTEKAFKKIGGFDESLYGPEDYDFHNRFVKAGFKWGRIQAIERHLGEPKSIFDIWRKHFFYGKQMVNYFKKYPSIATLQFNPVRISYLRHPRYFLTHPILFIGLIIMTIVKFLAGGLGFLIALITMYNPMNENSFEKRARQLYAGLGWVTFFTNIRFWTGSFKQIEKYVPKKGTILDLGCGYGILANYLAISGPDRKLIGIDTDSHKVSYADRKVPNTTFILGDATKIKMRKLDGIIIHDVLHHLPSYDSQEQLISNCYAMLSKGGVLIVIDVDNTSSIKLALGRLGDFILYRGQPVYYRYRKEMKEMLKKYFGGAIKEDILRNNPFCQRVYICQKN